MPKLTLTDLTGLLQECAGADEGVDLAGDVLDTAFSDLGYDSLALLQLTGRIESDNGIRLDEDAVAAAQTPREYLDMVNGALRTAA